MSLVQELFSPKLFDPCKPWIIVLVFVEPSSHISDCSVIQNTSHGTVCGSFQTGTSVCVKGTCVCNVSKHIFPMSPYLKCVK